MGESGSEFSHFIPEPGYVSEVTRLSVNTRKPWLKLTLKEINNLINNKTFLMEKLEKGYTVTRYMGVYKEKIQYDGSLEELKLRISIIGDLRISI